MENDEPYTQSIEVHSTPVKFRTSHASALEHADEGTILLKVAIVLVLVGGADVRFTFAIRRRRRFRENGIN